MALLWRELSLARAIFQSTMSCVAPLITNAVVGMPPNTRSQWMGLDGHSAPPSGGLRSDNLAVV